MLRVVELGVADARRQGLDLELEAVDDEADEAVAAAVARQLCDDRSIVAVVGHKNSGPSRAGAPLYAAADLAQLSQCSTDNALTRSGWRTFFRMCAGNERQAEVAADFAHSQAKARHLAAVHDGTGYGRPLVEAFATRVKALTGVRVSVLAMRVGQEEFGEIAGAIRDMRAGLVYIGATEVEGSKLTIALREAGIDAQVVTSEGGPHNPFPRLAGPAAEGSVHTYAGADPSSTPAARDLDARCIMEFGEMPSFMVECYDAMTAIASGLGGGATTRIAVREAIARIDVEGLAGRIRFDQFGDRVDAPVSLWRVERGRMVPFGDPAVR